MERRVQISDSAEYITIGITLSSQHIGKVIVKRNVLEKAVTSMLIYLNSLMTIIARNRDIFYRDITAVKDIYRIGEIYYFQIIHLGMGNPFHIYCVPAIVHFLRLRYAVVQWEAVMSEHSIPLAVQPQIANCDILQHGNVKHCRLVNHITRSKQRTSQFYCIPVNNAVHFNKPLVGRSLFHSCPKSGLPFWAQFLYSQYIFYQIAVQRGVVQA